MLTCSSLLTGKRALCIAGDFNSFDTTFLETDFGLTQIVTETTHGFNTLDHWRNFTLKSVGDQ